MSLGAFSLAHAVPCAPSTCLLRAVGQTERVECCKEICEVWWLALPIRAPLVVHVWLLGCNVATIIC